MDSKTSTKICHLTTVHFRYDTRIFIKECRSLAKNGYDVTLIVADGKGNEEKDGVKIIDVGKPKSRLRRILLFTYKIQKKGILSGASIFHFHDPELMFVGMNLKRKGYRVIFDIHEDVEEQIRIKEWIPKIIRNGTAFFFSKVESKVVKKYDALIVPQDFMFPKYSNLNEKTYVVENFSFVNKNKVELHKQNSKINQFNLFHAGSLNPERGLWNMTEIMSKMPSQVKLILAGKISDKNLKTLQVLQSKYNIEYLGILNKKELDERYLDTRCGLILYQNKGQYHRSYSVKLFEYMVNSIPVIMPNFGDWIPFNEKNKCGINVDPNNHDQVCEAIEFLMFNPENSKKMGENGRKAVLEKFNWGEAEKKLIKMYSEICMTT